MRKDLGSVYYLIVRTSDPNIFLELTLLEISILIENT